MGHRVLSYPKFHWRLNLIERYSCRARWLQGRVVCDLYLYSARYMWPEALRQLGVIIYFFSIDPIPDRCHLQHPTSYHGASPSHQLQGRAVCMTMKHRRQRCLKHSPQQAKPVSAGSTNCNCVLSMPTCNVEQRNLRTLYVVSQGRSCGRIRCLEHLKKGKKVGENVRFNMSPMHHRCIKLQHVSTSGNSNSSSRSPGSSASSPMCMCI